MLKPEPQNLQDSPAGNAAASLMAGLASKTKVINFVNVFTNAK